MTTGETNILDYTPARDTTVVYADFLTRLAALFIDVVIFGGILGFVIMKVLMSGWLANAQINEDYSYLVVFLYLFGPTLLRSLIFASFECTKYQGTPGKMLAGIKVVDKHGNRPSFLRAFGRNAGKTISAIILYIGFFLPLFSDRRQALHDMIASTYIIKK